MVGEVSIKRVDTAEFEEGAIRKKADVQAEGFMVSKVSSASTVEGMTLNCEPV